MADSDRSTEAGQRYRVDMALIQFHARMDALFGEMQREGFTAALDGTQDDRAEGQEARELARLEQRMDDLGRQDGQEQQREHGMGL